MKLGESVEYRGKKGALEVLDISMEELRHYELVDIMGRYQPGAHYPDIKFRRSKSDQNQIVMSGDDWLTLCEKYFKKPVNDIETLEFIRSVGKKLEPLRRNQPRSN